MMALFYKDGNNGVVAIVSEEKYREMEERRQLLIGCEKIGLPQPQLPTIRPVFTFARKAHPAFSFLTGSYDILEWLLKGHTVQEGSIWVPFSNGIQWFGTPEQIHQELSYRTSLDEAIKYFGLCRSQES